MPYIWLLAFTYINKKIFQVFFYLSNSLLTPTTICLTSSNTASFSSGFLNCISLFTILVYHSFNNFTHLAALFRLVYSVCLIDINHVSLSKLSTGNVILLSYSFTHLIKNFSLTSYHSGVFLISPLCTILSTNLTSDLDFHIFPSRSALVL